jgi:chitin disaccharide deacetylase
MVFMADSIRGAALAGDCDIDVGLHVNFTEEFTDPETPQAIRVAHNRIRRFLRLSKYALLLYNPLLAADFSTVFRAQYEAFRLLYGRLPSHIDGHQHMHLCSNVLMQRILPAGTNVRRSFSFRPGQKGFFNRAYRSIVDRQLAHRHRLTDYFFSIAPNLSVEKLVPIFKLATTHSVELMVHPELRHEYDFLMSEAFFDALSEVPLADYRAN